jgi:hypothetical protein
MERITYAAKLVDDLISQRGVQLSDDMELFLQLDETLDTISYYFIDHTARTQFWIDSQPTQLLNLPPVISMSHLSELFLPCCVTTAFSTYSTSVELVLEEHYWNHVANFPMHFGGLQTDAVDSLINVFAHGRAGKCQPRNSFRSPA